MNITKLQKEDIRAKLAQHVTLFSSQNKAANSLKGVSSATISQILNGKWDLISDEMWRNISAQVEAADNGPNWVVVETTPYCIIFDLLDDAQCNSLVYGAILRAGRGKTETIKSYVKTHKNVYALKCAGYWNKKRFLQ